MRKAILPIILATLIIQPAAAFDKTAVLNKLTACDGVLATMLETSKPATQKEEMHGMAVLELIDTIISPEGQSYQLAAKSKSVLNQAKSFAINKANSWVKDCDPKPNITPDIVPNPLN